MKRGGEYFFYHNDHLGTPQKMTSANGSTVWSAKYEAFGKADIDPASSLENNLRFPGQYYDAETGIHYNYHRYYEPRYGRYLAPDPSNSVQTTESGIPYLLPFRVVTPWELHPFHYVGSNTINWTDPTGLRYQPTTTLALEKAILTGNAAEVETLAYAMGLSIPPAIVTAIAAQEITGETAHDIIDRIIAENNKKLTECTPGTRQPERLPKYEPTCIERCAVTYATSWFSRWICYLGCILEKAP
jgi:RHS repeat-associated protein